MPVIRWGLALKKVSDILTAINDGKAVPPDTSYDKLVKVDEVAYATACSLTM